MCQFAAILLELKDKKCPTFCPTCRAVFARAATRAASLFPELSLTDLAPLVDRHHYSSLAAEKANAKPHNAPESGSEKC